MIICSAPYSALKACKYMETSFCMLATSTSAERPTRKIASATLASASKQWQCAATSGSAVAVAKEAKKAAIPHAHPDFRLPQRAAMRTSSVSSRSRANSERMRAKRLDVQAVTENSAAAHHHTTPRQRCGAV